MRGVPFLMTELPLHFYGYVERLEGQVSNKSVIKTV